VTLLLALACNSPSPPEDDALDVDEPRLYRLTHAQWEYSAQSVLLLDQRPGNSDGFLGSTLSLAFDNDTEVLLVDAMLAQDYQRAAEMLAHEVVRNEELYIELAIGSDDPEKWVKKVGKRAFRRPLRDSEVELWVDVFERGPELVGSGRNQRDSVQLVLQAMLQSPYFLYRVETGKPGEPLDGWEMAEKLSYTLWDRPPDAELRDDADRLTNKAVLREHAERMLADDKARVPVRRLYEEIWRLEDYVHIAKDTEWDEGLVVHTDTESKLFMDNVLFDEPGSLHTLLTATHTWANPDLAEIYEIEVSGDDFERVTLDAETRAGLLTQTGFLSLMAEDEQSNPIRRGGFVIDRLLCIELPPPPDETTGVGPMAEGLSNRERVERHTGAGTCGEGCHTLINPAGYAFEHYDGFGGWRDIDYGVEIDATGTFTLDGVAVSYDGAVEFANLLAESRQVHACHARQIVEYTHAREEMDEDETVIERIADASLEGATLLDLWVEAVTAESFRCNR